MKRLAIICEGRSEVEFVKNILSISIQNIILCPVTIVTGHNDRGEKAKGGALNYDRSRKNIINFLKIYDYVTTFFDYYGLCSNFPGYEQATHNDKYRNIKILESELLEDINKENEDAASKFIPYIQLHEFESLIFSDINKLFEFEDISHTMSSLQSALLEFDNNPELINGGIDTAPSKRIKSIFSGYQKTLHGYKSLERIGIDKICNKCKHFGEWITGLKNLN